MARTRRVNLSMVVCMLSSTDGKVLGFTLVFADVLKIGIGERIVLSYLVYPYEVPTDFNIDGSVDVIPL